MSTQGTRAVLRLTSPVHVANGDGVLHVRRMGLAMLAYVALEGPTRREQLADVIWGHRQALRNLRVELHRLRAAFATIGMRPLQASVDPLVLAPALDVAPVEDVSEFLVGLEDISSDYQAWVEHRRDLIERVSATSARDGLLEALSESIHPPFVLVVQGMSGSGRRTLATALAHRLRLPFVEGARGEMGAVRYLPPEHHDIAGLAARIRQDHRCVWVVGRSAYGADSRLLLELRASVPPERLRFEELRPLTWLEAKRGFLDRVAFHEGAALYLASSGHPAYLRELVTLNSAPATAPLPIPQRVRAALALEAVDLSESARLALERLSVLGYHFSPALVTVVKADAELDELERSGWLRYEDDTWRFADPIVAKVLRSRVPPGQRTRLQRLAAGSSSAEGPRRRAGPRLHAQGITSRRRQDPGSSDDRSPSWADGCSGTTPPPWTRVTPGQPIFLDDPQQQGDDVASDAGSIVWSRLASANGPTGIAWRLPDVHLVARLTGRIAMAPDVDADPSHDPTVVRVVVRGTDSPSIRLAAVGGASATDDASIWLPAGDDFEHWFLLPHGARGLDLTCHAASVVVELEVAVHRVDWHAPDGEGVVIAFDLRAAATLAPSDRGRLVSDPAIS